MHNVYVPRKSAGLSRRTSLALARVHPLESGIIENKRGEIRVDEIKSDKSCWIE